MNRHIRRVRTVRTKFRVGQHVRISKEKMKYEKGAEEIFIREIFRINKFSKRRPRCVYELEDLNKTPDRRSILSGRTNSCAHHKTDSL